MKPFFRRPTGPHLPESIRLVGGVPVIVDTDESTGYLASIEQLEAARTPKTKLLVFVRRPTRPVLCIRRNR